MHRRIGRGACLFLVYVGVIAFPLNAKVLFDGLDLSADGRLLFRASSDSGGAPPQTALFLADPAGLTMRHLTAFPEKMDILDSGRTIQIRNAFGASRISLSGGLPRTIPGFPSFADGAPALGGRVEELAPSADGKWLLYVEPVSAAFGNLVLIEAATGKRTSISRNVERPGRSFPASWSPDSRVFVYARGGRLYYQSLSSAASATVDERLRVIGEGSINSVFWGSAGDFFYLRGSTVYRVRSSELFARALYADFLDIGQPAGKIPFAFDANFDRFWVAPDSRSLLLSVGGRNLFYFPLGVDDYHADFQSSLPYLLLPRSSSELNVLWSPSGTATVMVSLPRSRESKTLAYRLDLSADKAVHAFVQLPDPVGSRAALSPDGTRALVWGLGGLAVYDYINWKVLSTRSGAQVLSAAWLGNESYVAGDGRRIERVELSGRTSLVCLSGAAEFGFEEKSGRIAVKDGAAWFTSDGTGPWTAAAEVALRPPRTASEKFRVYLERQSAGPYENIPMVRNTSGVGTTSLLIRNGAVYEAFPPELPGGNIVQDPQTVFNHGRRTGRRELALTFDLMDDAEGLPFVLDTLAAFKIRATFFLNGEFIRRHGAAAKEIAEAGHEIASLFFAPIDLSDGRYRIDAEFIHRGLARNEDEFFQATGYELALLWHPPYYATSPTIVSAAAAVGYRTIGRDVDPLDWVGRSEGRNISLPYRGASEMVDEIMSAKKPGSIIPLRLGLPPGGRNDYLFSRLDVLLDALVRAGYSVVPVSNLIEHGR